MISNRKPRVKSDLFEALAELSDFRGLNIRNLSGYTTTFTKLFPLSKKACCKQASLSALRSRSRRGCSRDGFQGRRVRGHLPPPRALPNYEDLTVNKIEIYNINNKYKPKFKEIILVNQPRLAKKSPGMSKLPGDFVFILLLLLELVFVLDSKVLVIGPRNNCVVGRIF